MDRHVSKSFETVAANLVARWYVVRQTGTDVYVDGRIDGDPHFQIDVTDLYGAGPTGAAGVAFFFECCDTRVVKRLEALAA